MKCQAAQRLVFAERDGALDSSERAELDRHLAECAECRRMQASLSSAVADWRARAAVSARPDVERAWQDIRREIRTATTPSRSDATARVLKWSIPLGAGAALAAALLLSPLSPWRQDPLRHDTPAAIARAEQPHADFVEVAGDASSLVYVDDQSGWLVVWAVNDDAHPAGG